MSAGNTCFAKDTVTVVVRNCPLQADFSYSPNQPSCPPVVVSFSDLSTGNPTSWHWDLGNGSTSSLKNVTAMYCSTGVYRVMLVASNASKADTIVKVLVITAPVPSFSFEATDTCSIFSRTFHFSNTSSNAVKYQWDMGDGTAASDFEPSHTFTQAGAYSVGLIASDANGCVAVLRKMIQVETYKPILPAAGALTLHATSECTDPAGWTNYFNDNSTPANTGDDILLLSLKKNGNDIGTTGVGNFDVSISATKGAGSNTGILLTNPLISNKSGFWVMNRYWQVKPITQPTVPVSVRFYFNKQDLSDVNGSYPNHNLNYTNLLFYKTIGGNPDPTSNLQGATRIISLTNSSSADTTHWVYTMLDSTRQISEFMVSRFSGGGGGAAGDGNLLPIGLLSFTATQQKNDVVLHWTSSMNADVEKYVVEKSLDGFNFIPVYSTLTENQTGKTSFTYDDKNATAAGESIYYRVKMVDKNGSITYSKIVLIGATSQQFNITISPNPAKDFIVIHSSSLLESLQLLLFDNMGRKITTIPVSNGLNERVSLPALPPGYYHISLMDKSKQVYQQNILIK